MKKQIMIIMACIMSIVTGNIMYAGTEEHTEEHIEFEDISKEKVPGWIEVRWADCEGADNVKHFRVGTPVEKIKMIFSLFKKSPAYFITISINGVPQPDEYTVKDNDYGVATPGTMRRVGGKPVENICYFIGDIMEKLNPEQIKMKEGQDILEKDYLEAYREKLSHGWYSVED